MGNPTRFKSGVNNSYVGQPMANYPQMDPTQGLMEDFEDFNQYVAGDWTVTNTTSHFTIALAAGAGGLLAATAGGSAVSTDIAAIISNPLNFNFTKASTTAMGNQVWFRTRFQVATALNDLLVLGLTSANATAAVSDGIYFTKAAGSASISFVVAKGSTATTQTAIATLVDATYIDLAYYYNGKDTITVFVNGKAVYSQTTLTNIPDATALGLGAAMKVAVTSPTTAVLTLDYLFGAQEISR